MRTLLVFLTLALGSGLAAPNPVAVVKRPVVAKAAAPRLSDAELERQIQARFAKSKIGVEKFTVRVQGGAATIEGRTDVIQRKGTATRLARLAGATRVDNRVQISDAARLKAAGNLAKHAPRSEMKRAAVVGK